MKRKHTLDILRAYAETRRFVAELIEDHYPVKSTVMICLNGQMPAIPCNVFGHYDSGNIDGGLLVYPVQQEHWHFIDKRLRIRNSDGGDVFEAKWEWVFTSEQYRELANN